MTVSRPTVAARRPALLAGYRAVWIMAATMTIAWPAPRAVAGHWSGATYELVGFSLNGRVLTRHRDAQYGITRFELLAVEDGREVDSVYVPPTADPEAIRAEQLKSHSIVSAGFPGAVSPRGTAAVVVSPGRLSTDGTGRFDIWLADGAGTRIVASLPLESECGPDIPGPSARLSVDWAPSGRIAVVSGHLNIEAPCESPQRVPVLVLVRSRAEQVDWSRNRLLHILSQATAGFGETRPHDALPIVRQWLAVAPSSVDARAELVRLRARLGDLKGAMAALWSLVRLGAPGRTVASALLLEHPITPLLSAQPSFELLRPLLPAGRRLPATMAAYPRRAGDIPPGRRPAQTSSPGSTRRLNPETVLEPGGSR